MLRHLGKNGVLGTLTVTLTAYMDCVGVSYPYTTILKLELSNLIHTVTDRILDSIREIILDLVTECYLLEFFWVSAKLLLDFLSSQAYQAGQPIAGH